MVFKMGNEKIEALNKIAKSQIDVVEAYEILHPLLYDIDEKMSKHIYTTLRAWVWKAIHDRRRDTALRDWFHLLRHVKVRFEVNSLTQAKQIETLYELIQESINTSSYLDRTSMISRPHIQSILILVKNAKHIDHDAIMEELGLTKENLIRTIDILSALNLIEKTTTDHIVTISLTYEGLRAAGEISQSEQFET